MGDPLTAGTDAEEHQQAGFVRHWTQAQPVVTAYLASCIPGPAEADDLLQDVALVAHRRWRDFDSQQDFLAWTLGIARNVLRNHRRAQQRSRLVHDDELLALMAETAHQEAAILKRYGVALRRCLERLNPRIRRLIRAHHLDNQPQMRLAEQEGMSHAAVRTALHRGRERLRSCLEQTDG